MSGLGDAVVVVPGKYLISPGDEPIRQDPDFWYLTGVESPYAILVLAPDRTAAQNAPRWRSVLFLPTEFQFAGQFPMADSAFRRAPWNRPVRRLVPGAMAQAAVRVDATFPVDSFAVRLRQLAADTRVLYIPTGATLYSPVGLEPPQSYQAQFAHSIAGILPDAEVRDVHPLIARLRAVKDDHEIDALRRAAKVAGDGLIEAMRATRAGLNDREIGGLMEYVWKRAGSPRAAFTPIVMSGPNLMTLFTLQIAIMIEDEILVTPTGHEILSAHVPKRADDIERVMAEGRRARAWDRPDGR